MKLKGILLTSALTAMLGVGVFAGVSGNKNVSKAYADTVAANTKVYLNTSPNTGWESGALLKMWFKKGGSDACNATGTLVTVKGSSDHIYVFTPTAQYDSIYVERRKSDDSEHWNGFDISGSASSNVIKLDSSDWNKGAYDSSTYNIYYQTLTAPTNGTASMYLKGDSTKSGNGYYYAHNGLTLTASANSGYHFVRWERNGTQVSTDATYTINTIGGDYTWNAVFAPDVYYTVNFYMDDKSTLYDSVNVLAGTTATCSKSNPTKAQVGGLAYTFSGWKNNDGTAADLTNISDNKNVYASFSSSYVSGRYIVGKSGDWSIESATYMVPNGNGIYTGTITLAYGDEVRIPYYNNNHEFEWNASIDSYNAVTYNAAAYKYFGDGDNHNIKCYAAGSYTFYFTDGNYDDTYKISVAYNGALTAQHLAANLMSFGPANPGVAGDRTCGDAEKFPAMKSMYLNDLSEGEQSTFRGYASSATAQFKNAYDRYVACSI